MKKVRQIIAYKDYFETFLKKQPKKVQDKIYKVLEAIETLERVPGNYLKSITGTKGLYEARIKLASKYLESFLLFRQRKTGYSVKWIYKKDTENSPKRN